jgi:RNA polymerase sigma factor (sigma-70 family)
MNKATQAGSYDQFHGLIRAVAEKRDIAAYEEIFRFYAPRVKAYMLRLTKDAQLADDLMQEAMVAVWNKADRYDPAKGALSTWIFTIARNLRVDALRREKRPEFSADDPAFVPDEEISADAGMIVQQAADELRLAMEKLPSDQLSILKMSFYDDYSQRAIADKMNIPLGTVKSRMRLAMEKLRATFLRSGDAS